MLTNRLIISPWASSKGVTPHFTDVSTTLKLWHQRKALSPNISEPALVSRGVGLCILSECIMRVMTHQSIRKMTNLSHQESTQYYCSMWASSSLAKACLFFPRLYMWPEIAAFWGRKEKSLSGDKWSFCCATFFTNDKSAPLSNRIIAQKWRGW